MTREQAINYLISSGFSEEQVSEVVRALTYEPTNKNDSSELEKNSKKLEKDFGEWDCISRERMKQIVFNITAEYNTETIHIDRLIDEIDNLPSVTPQPCEDAVSRQEVLDLIADYDLSMGQVVRGIHALPSVTPQTRKGYWIECMLGGAEEWCYKCSECNFWKYKKTINLSKFKFCPNCGADMREVEE